VGTVQSKGRFEGYMQKNNELKAITFLICIFLLTVSVYPVSAVAYNPGVSAGQYVKYGNIVGTQNGEDLNEIAWLSVEVVAVSGKNVTLHSSGQFENGSTMPAIGQSTIIYNIEEGKMTMNGNTVDYTFGPIIAANLNEGDLIPPTSYGYIVNRTETRMYLNESRSVNILNRTYSDANYASTYTIVYDKATGMMLESLIEVEQKTAPAMNMTFSYSVIETNLFNPIEQPEPFYLQPWFWILTIIIVAAVIALVALWMRRK